MVAQILGHTQLSLYLVGLLLSGCALLQRVLGICTEINNLVGLLVLGQLVFHIAQFRTDDADTLVDELGRVVDHTVLGVDDVVFVNLRFTAFGIVPALEFPESDESVTETPADARKGSSQMFFYDRFYESEVWDRAKMPAGSKVHGPAMIEEYASSTPIPPNHTAEIDRYHNILITRD